jgi:hypothetical protein
MTALTLGVVGVFVLWQVWPAGQETTVPIGSPARGNTSYVATPRSTPMEQYPEDQRARSSLGTDTTETLDGVGALLTRTATPTVYLVKSEDRAQTLLACIEETNSSRAALGLPPLEWNVVWFDSAEAEADFWLAEGSNQFRDGIGMVAVSIIDLRERLVAACTGQGAPGATIVRDICS